MTSTTGPTGTWSSLRRTESVTARLAATVALSATIALACGDAGDGGTAETTDSATAATDASETGETSVDSAATTDSAASTTSEGDDPWASPYCQQVADDRPVNGWLEDWGAREQAMLEAVNNLRSSPTTCGKHGELPAASPLVMNPRAQCAARSHSLDMATRDFFGHENPDGELVGDRFNNAGYSYAIAGENLAGGVSLESAEQALAGLLTSDDHCANMMGPDYTEFGAGFVEGSGALTLYWTQTFGRPAGS